MSVVILAPIKQNIRTNHGTDIIYTIFHHWRFVSHVRTSTRVLRKYLHSFHTNSHKQFVNKNTGKTPEQIKLYKTRMIAFFMATLLGWSPATLLGLQYLYANRQEAVDHIEEKADRMEEDLKSHLMETAHAY